jgi:ribosomal-protein-alanine N-acetyltransferase
MDRQVAGEQSRKVLAVHIRWMIRKDMPEVMEIENAAFQFPWREEDFINCLRQRNCIGMVAEHAEQVAGFMIYELHKSKLHVLNFAVHGACQMKGVGRQMVKKLIDKLSCNRRSRIMLEVRESNLDAQLFYRRMGFKAVSVIRGFYYEIPEDAFLMQYRIGQSPDS